MLKRGICMAFFDDISKKLSQVSQNAVGKTKDTADIFKLKNEISEEERKIVALYNEIGRLYASLHYEDFEPSFANLMASLKESVAAIELRQAQIQNIRNVTTCSNCGAEIARESMFCSACGAQKEARVEVSSPLRCASCGKPLENGSKFCTYCGTPVQDSAPVAPVAPVTPVDPFAPATPVAPAEVFAPAEPFAPATPYAPVAPVAPATPVTPTSPAPYTPGAPVVPVVESDVFTPATAYTPVAPVASASPVAPVMSVSPVADMPNEATVSTAVHENPYIKLD